MHIKTSGGEERAVETLTHRHTHSCAHANNVERGKINKDGRKGGVGKKGGGIQKRKRRYILERQI
jgi:hypothetical protein